MLFQQQGLTQSGALDVDIETVQISGNITVNHALAPSGLTGTYLTFGDLNVWLLSKGATYSVLLLAGSDPVGVATTDTVLTSVTNGQSKTLVVCP